MKRTWAARVGLVGLGLLAGLVLAEGLLRVAGPRADAELLFSATDFVPEGLYGSHRLAIYGLAPGFEGELHAPGIRVPLRVNSLGLRGGEVRTESPLLVVGDSFTLAMQVPEEQTFEHLLGEQMGIEVLNGGVDGYSTFHAAGLYEELAEQIDLQGVLLVFFLGNDPHDNQIFRPHGPRGLWSDPEARSPGPHLSASQLFGLRHSRIWTHWVIHQRGQEMAQPGHQEHQRWRREVMLFSTEGATELASLERRTEQALRDLSGRARRAGHPLRVALAPPAFAVHPERLEATFELLGLDPSSADIEAPARSLTRILAQVGIEACDLGPALRASAEQGGEPYLRYDGHWSAEGHEVVASALAACLSE